MNPSRRADGNRKDTLEREKRRISSSEGARVVLTSWGACWLLMVHIQHRMRCYERTSAVKGNRLNASFFRTWWGSHARNVLCVAGSAPSRKGHASIVSAKWKSGGWGGEGGGGLCVCVCVRERASENTRVRVNVRVEKRGCVSVWRASGSWRRQENDVGYLCWKPGTHPFLCENCFIRLSSVCVTSLMSARMKRFGTTSLLYVQSLRGMHQYQNFRRYLSRY